MNFSFCSLPDQIWNSVENGSPTMLKPTTRRMLFLCLYVRKFDPKLVSFEEGFRCFIVPRPTGG